MNKFKFIQINPLNVSLYSSELENIYRKGYKYDEKTEKGLYPNQFVYHSNLIEKYVIGFPTLLDWYLVKEEETPLGAMLSICDKDEVEMLALVWVPESRGKGNFTTGMYQFLSDLILSYFNSGMERVIGEAQLVAPQVIMSTIFGNGIPVGFCPNMRKIESDLPLNRMSLYNSVFFQSYYYRKNEILTIKDCLKERSDKNIIIQEIKELAFSICEYLNIEKPKIEDIEIFNGNDEICITIHEKQPIDHIFYTYKQLFTCSEENKVETFIHEIDRSIEIKLEELKDRNFLSEFLKIILESNRDIEMFSVSRISDIKTQKILSNFGFLPVSYIPGSGSNHMDSITMIKLSNFGSFDVEMIEKKNIENKQYLSKVIEKYFNSNPQYFAVSNQVFNITDIIINLFKKSIKQEKK